MLKFIVGDCPSENNTYVIHNASSTCQALPDVADQVLIGYFTHYELAYKRARMNWPREKMKTCEHCCIAVAQ